MTSLCDSQIDAIAALVSSEQAEKVRYEHDLWKVNRDRSCAEVEGVESILMRELECLQGRTEEYFERRELELAELKAAHTKLESLCGPTESKSYVTPPRLPQPEGYAVLNDLLRAMYGDSPVQVVLQLETTPQEVRASEIESLRSRLSRNPSSVSLPTDLVDSFCFNNETPHMLDQRQLNLPKTVLFASSSDRGPRGPKVHLSSPGISDDRDYALVSVYYKCGILCGGETLVLLRKELQQWKVVAEYGRSIE
jgi:hypothetical protein